MGWEMGIEPSDKRNFNDLDGQARVSKSFQVIVRHNYCSLIAPVQKVRGTVPWSVLEPRRELPRRVLRAQDGNFRPRRTSGKELKMKPSIAVAVALIFLTVRFLLPTVTSCPTMYSLQTAPLFWTLPQANSAIHERQRRHTQTIS